MAGSGVMRLRLARKGGGTNPRVRNSMNKHNDVKPNVNVGSALDPGPNPKSHDAIFKSYPNTPAPISNEQPTRGEHGRNPHRTSRKD